MICVDKHNNDYDDTSYDINSKNDDNDDDDGDDIEEVGLDVRVLMMMLIIIIL